MSVAGTSAKVTGKRVLFEKEASVVIADWQQPHPQAGQALVKNVASLVSAGTELSRLYNYHPKPQPFPTNTGYASVVEVIEVGPDVDCVQVGKKYLAQMGHISHGIQAADSLIEIPDNVAPEHAVFSILAAIALRAVRQAKVSIGDSVLVVGLGLIGQFAQTLSRIAGGNPVVAGDLSPKRRGIAEEMGLLRCLDPLTDDYQDQLTSFTESGQYRVTIDSTGTPQVFAQLPALTENNGRVMILGGIHKTVDFDFYTHAQKRNLRIIGAGSPDKYDWPWDEKANRQALLRLMADGQLDVAPLLTHHVPMEKAPEIYPMLHTDKDACMGAVFSWEG
ncbi:MAG: zinc-binding alcohol dehydrogenase [Planctomycetes bacterium]|nr:zinc-binding alcohol dehydrogenase [Planctomycetota bacterium]